jgi:mevalonate kinase
VLDGAMALAVPTRYGQDMIVNKDDHQGLVWQSIDCEDDLWFDGEFDISTGKYLNGTDEGVGNTLEQMFMYILSIHPDFLNDKDGTLVTTYLDFPRDWGLGSSSTMIYNLAQWADVDPYLLLANTMGGSGYDIACAGTDHPILYQRQNDKPFTKKAKFDPSFKENLFFVYLGQKQNSRSGIKYYREHVVNNPRVINNMSIITKRLLNSTKLSEFESLIKHHEKVLSSLLKMKRVKKERFPDYWGQVKSLGAWGGDFVLVTSKKSRKKTAAYFKEKGYEVFFSYDEIIL